MEFNSYQTIFLICSALGIFALMMLVLLPSMFPEKDDFYNP